MVDFEENNWEDILDDEESGNDLEPVEDYTPPEDEVYENVDDKKDTEEDEPKEEEAPTADKPPKKKSRAQERIRQLAAEKNELKAEIEKLRKESSESRRKSAEQEKSSYQSQYELLDKQISAKKQAYIQAMTEGDVEAAAAIIDELSDLKLDARVLKARSEQIVIPEEAEEQKADEQVDIPEQMQDWLSDNRWFMQPKTVDDRIKQAAVVAMADDLKAQGYSEFDDEFYTELDTALEKRFGTGEKSMLDSEQNSEDETSSPATSSKKSASQPKRTVSKSVVSGASRAPNTSKGRVSLSAQERAMAKKLGVSEERYAAQKTMAEAEEPGWIDVLGSH